MITITLTYDELIIAEIALRDRALQLNGCDDMEALADKLHGYSSNWEKLDDEKP